jgi:Ca2+-transporting ATPase
MGFRMVLMALSMTIGTLYLFIAHIDADLTKAWTVSLTVLAVFQWLNAWNCRSGTESIFRTNPFSNRYLVGATLIVVTLQLFALYTPFLQTILHTMPLSLAEWGMIFLVASPILIVEEVRKLVVRTTRRFASA